MKTVKMDLDGWRESTQRNYPQYSEIWFNELTNEMVGRIDGYPNGRGIEDFPTFINRTLSEYQ